MLTTNFASGFGSNYIRVLPETVYPPFSQVLVFTTPTESTRIKLPNYVNTVRVYAWGGGGAGGGKGPGTLKVPGSPPSSGGSMPGGTGGDGGFVQGDFPISAGTILKVRVAGGGKNVTQSSPVGSPNYADGSGGGYSSVELPLSFPLYHLVVAGGGGGGGRAPTATGPTPSPAVPPGQYYGGGDGGPAFANGAFSGNLSRDFGWTYNGLAGTISAGGESGMVPIGSIPVPNLGPVSGPIYGPLPPTSGPSKQALPGSFLKAGGDAHGTIITAYDNTTTKFTGYGGMNGGGNYLFGPVYNPSSPTSNRYTPGYYAAFPGTNYQPGSWSVEAAGGGGGYYGGGQAISSIGPLFTNYGQAGGGGGSSYIHPTGTNTAMANTGPYTPNPYYSTYHTAAPPDVSAPYAASTARGGNGFITPTSAAWMAQHGGNGLVVIVY